MQMANFLIREIEGRGHLNNFSSRKKNMEDKVQRFHKNADEAIAALSSGCNGSYDFNFSHEQDAKDFAKIAYQKGLDVGIFPKYGCIWCVRTLLRVKATK
jgi:hypothetical protein